MRRKVLEIRDVEVAALEDGRVLVRARGLVPALGWSAPELVPYTTIAPPRDGIHEFDFVAEAPDAGSPSVIDALVAELRVRAKGVVGVRVHGSLNALVGVLRRD
jgi:hypothetical protein